MKIIHVDTGKVWRGGQRQCYLLHAGLLERGMDSHLLCRAGSAFDLKQVPHATSIAFGGEVDPFTVHRLSKQVKGADIVHSHDAHSLTPLLILKMLGARFQLVHTRRVDFSVNKGSLSLYKYNNKHVNLVAISGGVKKVLVQDGIPSGHIHIIYSGTPQPPTPDKAKVDAIRAEFGLTDVGMVFGTVANFSPHKDLPTMLQAYATYLKKSNISSRLLMVGDGPLFNDTVTLARELKIAENVIFSGFRTDITELMWAMDIFLVSSEFEGLNTSIIDAMHMGRPVIATDAGGIGELVGNDENGFLAQPKDDKTMAELMLRLSQDKALMERFGYASAAKATMFTDSAMVEHYIELYKDLVV